VTGFDYLGIIAAIVLIATRVMARRFSPPKERCSIRLVVAIGELAILASLKRRPLQWRRRPPLRTRRHTDYKISFPRMLATHSWELKTHCRV
jgi:hypothetical protein